MRTTEKDEIPVESIGVELGAERGLLQRRLATPNLARRTLQGPWP